MGNWIGWILDFVGKVFGSITGLIIALLKVAIVISIIQGIFTGDWRNLLLCGILVVFIILTGRYAGNMIAFFSTVIPFSDELFDIDPSLKEKGEKFREDGYNVFKK